MQPASQSVSVQSGKQWSLDGVWSRSVCTLRMAKPIHMWLSTHPNHVFDVTGKVPRGFGASKKLVEVSGTTEKPSEKTTYWTQLKKSSPLNGSIDEFQLPKMSSINLPLLIT